MKLHKVVSGDITRFVMNDVAPEYLDALPVLVVEEYEGGFARAYRSDAPHIDSAYRNFERFTEPMLRQTSGISPIPWSEALITVLDIIEGHGLDWWLTGSAALSVRGLNVIPSDIDFITGEADALNLGDLLVDYLVQPMMDTSGWIGKWFGRAFPGARVEWVGGVVDWVDDHGITDFGPAAAARLLTIEWCGRSIRVPPLDLQLAVNERRGRLERAQLIRQAMDAGMR
jgi:hypothetical protein